MSLTGETDIVISADEQARRFDYDSATSDFKWFVQLTEQTLQEIYDRDDSNVFDLESYEPIEGVLDWTEIADAFKKLIIAPIFLDARNLKLQASESTCDPSLIERNTVILGGYSSQAQSDLVVIAEEEKQSDKTDTACIEKISQVKVTERVESIFRAIAEEVIEGEIAEKLAKDFSELLRQYEGVAVNEIEHFILKEEISPESAEAVLLILGDTDHKPTYNYRRWLLEKALIYGSSPVVRDGANVGLAYMDDPHAIPFLKKAIRNEENPLLLKVMNKTLFQLEDTQRCLYSYEVQNTTNG